MHVMSKDLSDIGWSIHEAFHHDLPGRYVPPREIRGKMRAERWDRPDPTEIEVHAWTQTWSSTALGMGGLGGAAMSDALTIVVQDRLHAAVYVGRFLRGVVKVDAEFIERVRERKVITGRHPKGELVAGFPDAEAPPQEDA